MAEGLRRLVCGRDTITVGADAHRWRSEYSGEISAAARRGAGDFCERGAWSVTVDGLGEVV